MLEYDEAVAAAGGSHENQEYKYREEIGGHVKRYSIPMLIITIFGIGAGVASLFLIGSEDENGWSMGLYNANGIWGSVFGLLGAIIGIMLSSWKGILFGKCFSCFYGLFWVTHGVCSFTCSFMAISGIGGALAACWKQFVANPLQMTVICCESLFLILIMINSLRSFHVIYVRGKYYNRILPSNASVRLEIEAQSEENQQYSTP